MLRAALFGCALFLGWMSDVSAKESTWRVPLALGLELDRSGCQLGDVVKAKVTLTNVGKEKATVKELLHDRQCVDFDIVLSGGELEEKIGPFRFTKITTSVYDPRQMREVTLDPGKSLDLTVEIPAISGGEMRLTARYSGVVFEDVLPFSLVSRTVTLKVESKPKERLTARLKTRRGDIVIGFFLDEAPATVMHFVMLARSEFYDGLLFHRIVEDFVVQTGCPRGNGTGDGGYNIPAEVAGLHNHTRGAVAMARSDNFDSAGSQFYFCLKPQETLDGWYTVFGEVLSGMDAVDAMEPHNAIEQLRPERAQSP